MFGDLARHFVKGDSSLVLWSARGRASANLLYLEPLEGPISSETPDGSVVWIIRSNSNLLYSPVCAVRPYHQTSSNSHQSDHQTRVTSNMSFDDVLMMLWWRFDDVLRCSEKDTMRTSSKLFSSWSHQKIIKQCSDTHHEEIIKRSSKVLGTPFNILMVLSLNTEP